MSTRTSYAFAVVLLLTAIILRLASLATLPPGLHDDEITDLRITETIRQGNVAVYFGLHDEAREGLYHSILAGHTSSVGIGLISYRIFSVWIGLITVALAYAVGKRLFGPLAGLVAMAVLAVNMVAVILSRSVGREVMVMGLVTAVLLTSALAFPVYGRRMKSIRDGDTTAFALLGALLGFGLYIHPLGMMVVLASMVFIAYTVITQRPLSRRRRGYVFFALLVFLILGMPYLTSSIRQPELGGPGRLLGDYGSLLHSVIDGLAGLVFVGDMNAAHNLPGRPLIDLVSGLLAMVGLATAIRYWRQPRFALALIVLLAILPVTLLATGSPNFATMMGVLPVIALFVGVGAATIIKNLPRGSRKAGMVALLALLMFNVVWTARDLFDIWPQNAAMQQAYHARSGQLAHYLDQTADTIPTVLCDANLNLKTPPPNLSSAQLIALMMNNQSAPLRLVDCRGGLVFANGGDPEQVILSDEDTIDAIPAQLQNWLERGEFLERADVPPDSVIGLDVSGDLADMIGLFTTTTPIMYPPEVADDSVPFAPPVQFGDNLTFLGYEIDNPPIYPPDSIVLVTTYWRVDGVLPKNLTLFTHMLADPGAAPAANTDTLSVDPERLQKRDIFIQVTPVMIPVFAPEGDYWISVGAYRDIGIDKPRLDVLADGEPRGNRLFLYRITVSKNG